MKTAARKLDDGNAWLAANKKFGERIAFYRNKRNLTQEELGDAVGRDWRSVSRWESGNGGLKMSVITFVKLATNLGVDAKILLAGIAHDRATTT